ncbi:MAG: MBL fold metallo-hydrolase [Sphingobacteriaceae bacterium]|nr:MBL fold metallo-hydrolase [Sphingobacteriaceae bacterium]
MTTQAQNFRTIKAGNYDLDVFNASENSFGVASVIVSGKTDAILIDAQFTLADAETVAQKIKATGKKLTTIYISHNDPDFYFGLEVFKKHFPEVTAYAVPAVVEQIIKSAQKKLDVWGERLGKAITSNVVLPQVLKGNTIELEGEKFDIVGLEDFPGKTFVYIPSAKAVVGGINVFGNGFNLWMADVQTAEARSKWIEILDRIIALNPTIVIPAHGKAGDALDLTSVKHTKDYILFYEEALKTNKTSEALIKAIKAKYPNLTFETALMLGAKVLTGEMTW